jgi:hypothetical protein
MLGGRPKVRYDPPACATLALSNEHFAVVMAAASTVPLESRRWFFEAVALSLRGAPITDVAVSAALEQAVEVWGAAQD